MNVEHRTLNAQHRIMNSNDLKNAEQRELVRLLQAQTPNASRDTFAGCGSFILKQMKRSAINIRRSMFDVRCSMFNLFTITFIRR